MDLLFGLIIVSIIIFCIGIKSWETVEEAVAESKRKHQAKINSIKNQFKERTIEVDNILSDFFSNQVFIGATPDDMSYQKVYIRLTGIISRMKEINKEIKEESRNDNFSYSIDQYACLAADFSDFGKRVYQLPNTIIMDAFNYGKIQKKYWEVIRSLSRKTADNIIDTCEHNIFQKNFSQIFTVDIEIILLCVWVYATEKPYSVKDFNKARSVFYRLVKKPHIDVTIAELYAMKQVGGEDVLRERIRNILTVNRTPEELTLIASALMWMNAYQAEKMILQHMLSSEMQMTAKTQERFHSLTSGGDKAPNRFNVSSNENSIYFDVSALAWKDDEYTGLFDNLAFQEKILSYSLAVRDEDKELLITQGISIPDTNEFFGRLNSVFAEEYGDIITVSLRNCIALSGSGEEHMDGILVESNECRQMGILVYVVRIGKKLNIKFYTLFMPIETEISRQKQQVLSLYKKLSPSVIMWESSMKDTVLLVIQQVLNSGVQSIFATGTTATDSEDPILSFWQ